MQDDEIPDDLPEEPAREIGAEDVVLRPLEAIEEAEIDNQVATAKKYPRSLTKFRRTLREYVTASPKIAAGMFYSLPRGKDERGKAKFIEGESVRLAECAVAAWGNTRSGARTGTADATHVTCQGFARDLENNNHVAFEIRRRITGKSGRFNEDMITVTGAAGAKIAWRNAIFGIVPKIYVREAFQAAKQCALGSIKSIADARKDALEWWLGLGKTTKEQLFGLLGRDGIDDVSLDDLLRVKGLRTALDDGEITLDSLLGRQQGETVKPGSLTPDKVAEGKTEKADDAPRPGQTDAKGRPVLATDEHGPVVVGKARPPAQAAPEGGKTQASGAAASPDKKAPQAGASEPKPPVGETESDAFDREVDEAVKLFGDD